MAKDLPDVLAELEQANSRISALTTERDTAAANVTALTAERDAAVSERDTFKTQVDALTTERDTAKASLANAEAKIGTLEAAEKDLDKRVAAKVAALGLSSTTTAPAAGSKNEPPKPEVRGVNRVAAALEVQFTKTGLHVAGQRR